MFTCGPSLLARAAAAPASPSQVASLLLHCNGVNASNVFTDSSLTPKAVSALGTAPPSISTATSQFGGASGVFDGSSGYLTTPSHADFQIGTGDFTLETWIKPTNVSGYKGISSIQEAVNGAAFQFRLNAAALEVVLRGAGGVGLITITGGTIVTTAFQHVAVTRSSGAVRLFVGGGLVASGTSNVDLTPPVARPFTVGVIDDTTLSFYYAGNIDELRFTKGLARYTAAFTPAAAEFTAD